MTNLLESDNRDRIQVAFISDSNALKPTLLSLWSVLRNASAEVRVIFLGVNLAETQWSMVEKVVGRFPRASLAAVPFDEGDLRGAATMVSHISPAAFVRIFLHRYARGRVLYLDGDLLVTGDIAELGHVDLGSDLVAATTDYQAMYWSHRRIREPRVQARAERRLQHRAALVGDATRYFNAGVLLMDLDAIRKEADLVAELEDVERASSYPLGDQDHLNSIFVDRVTFLSPEWNCSWGRLRKHRAFLRSCAVEPAVADSGGRQKIIHYHGPHKPWRKVPLKRLMRCWWPVLQYRMARRAFLRNFPDLAF